jgi:hypothetical protein
MNNQRHSGGLGFNHTRQKFCQRGSRGHGNQDGALVLTRKTEGKKSRRRRIKTETTAPVLAEARPASSGGAGDLF